MGLTQYLNEVQRYYVNNTINVGNMPEEKTTLVRIETSIYTRLQNFLKGKVPFKSASSYIGELIVKALNSEPQIAPEEKEEDSQV